ncbi:MAG: recombinase family protein [Selenomonadaceae bacterium]|nr:recombinase family protein [Selenomonadaceae bacterium]
MQGITYGYVRVSTKDQNEDRQLIAMENFGIPPDKIFIDKHSGKNFERPAYKNLLAILQPSDTVVIKSIDRLGRDYEEIINQWRLLTKEKKSNIVVLDMPLLDTRNQRDLIGTLITDLVLQILSYVAQTEKEFNHQRQAEGIAAAKARGVKFGRKPIEQPKNFSEVFATWQQGKISARKAAKILGVSHNTFLKWAENN